LAVNRRPSYCGLSCMGLWVNTTGMVRWCCRNPKAWFRIDSILAFCYAFATCACVLLFFACVVFLRFFAFFCILFILTTYFLLHKALHTCMHAMRAFEWKPRWSWSSYSRRTPLDSWVTIQRKRTDIADVVYSHASSPVQTAAHVQSGNVFGGTLNPTLLLLLKAAMLHAWQPGRAWQTALW